MSEVLKQCETKQPVYGGIVKIDDLQENLRQNCIPEGLGYMDIKDYPEFLAARRELMVQKIRDYYWKL